MNFKVVSNSTPLIALSQINRLDIIKDLFGSIIIPDAVGLLLRYYRGKKEDFKLALDELIAKGFRLSEREYEKFLMMADQEQG